MASISKSSVSLTLTFLIFLLFLTNTVRSYYFLFPDPNYINQIGFTNDASFSSDSSRIVLTKKDDNGKAQGHSVGQVSLSQPFIVYDGALGIVADFTIEFDFVVNRQASKAHGDGFTFFFVPTDFNFPGGDTSGGGFLGLFTSTNPSQVPIVAVEFDSFANEWDPNPVTQFCHVGIDVNSVVSVVTDPWLSDVAPNGMTGHATITYDSKAQELSVYVKYDGSYRGMRDDVLSYNIDLRSVLPEQVKIGFSAATGDLVETHDIFRWSVTSTL